MDASREQDLQLQKSSPVLISELQQSLPRLLRGSGSDSSSHGSMISSPDSLRRRVRQSKTDQLIKLLDSFQEWPQLLDPHLSGLLQPLVSAFIEYLHQHASNYHQNFGTDSSSDKIPLSRAICQLLYTFCKVRGQKVIVRFLNNEPRHLEPMLDAFESWSKPKPGQDDSSSSSMVWQERFVMLWWLSHLMLAPFDLASMSSDKIVTGSGATCFHIRYPANTPPIARRLIYVSSFYLSSASKEREAAGLLLTRLTLRPDMIFLNLHTSIVGGILASLAGGQVAISPSASTYALLGLLHFLARFIASVELHILQPLFLSIHKLAQRLMSVEAPLCGAIRSSPLARKIHIKVSKELLIASVGLTSRPPYTDFTLEEEYLQDAIVPLFTALEDKDTVVRVAASKAISQIAPRLNDDLAGQIVSYLFTSLGVNPQLWQTIDIRRPNSLLTGLGASVTSIGSLPMDLHQNLQTKDPFQWHGLVLALSHLMFRKAISPPDITLLADILLLALNFEQKTELGASLGTNVRDAACFGLWSLARQLSTSQITFVRYRRLHAGSLLQPIANCLVIVATLDPAGNIRRGASAALQELIGRHPNMILAGIKLVQVVDYHAIALRSKAMLEVAIDAARIDEVYWGSVWDGLLSWRGVFSADMHSRCQAAEAIGRLTAINGINRRQARTFIRLREHLNEFPVHDFERRHGLFLAMAQVIRAMPEVLLQEGAESQHLPRHLERDEAFNAWGAFSSYTYSFCTDHDPSMVGSSPIYEGVCGLISAISVSFSDPRVPEWFKKTLEPTLDSREFCFKVMNFGLRSEDPSRIQLAAETAANIFRFLYYPEREWFTSQWIRDLNSVDLKGKAHLTMITVLGAVFHELGGNTLKNSRMSSSGNTSQQVVTTPTQSLIIETLLKQLEPENPTDQKCATLRRLTSEVLQYQLLRDNARAPETIIDKLSIGIFKALGDFTINNSGDVGSLVRLEAIDAAAMLLERQMLNDYERKCVIAELGSLAVGKLDKVRWKAWDRVRPHLVNFGLNEKEGITDMAQTSSGTYFGQLLFLTSLEWARIPFLRGFVTSAGSGSESLAQASRGAFSTYVETLSQPELNLLCNTVVQLFTDTYNQDRIAVPTMEFMIFLFDANIFQQILVEESSWRRVFRLVQQSHHKSKNILKIEIAIKLYAALATSTSMTELVLTKLCNMLLHRFAVVRNAASECMAIFMEDQEIAAVNWFLPIEELESTVQALRSRLGMLLK